MLSAMPRRMDFPLGSGMEELGQQRKNFTDHAIATPISCTDEPVDSLSSVYMVDWPASSSQ